jgi:hypothetical protein
MDKMKNTSTITGFSEFPKNMISSIDPDLNPGVSCITSGQENVNESLI